VDNSFSCAFYY